MSPEIEQIVSRHISELNQLTELGEITQLDRDRIGIVMGSCLGVMNEMSDKAWETLQRLVSESRVVWMEVETERNK